jgi:trimeric autotransporter adhesin
MRNIFTSRSIRTITFLLLSFLWLPSVQAAPLCGTIPIGPTGTYTTLTSAFADVNVQGMCGPIIFELQSTYTSSGETSPLTISTNITSSTNTITVRPAVGATNLVIAPSSSSSTGINLTGAKYITIDGRPGGTGTTRQLTIKGSGSGGALQLINGASNNNIIYCDMAGINPGTNSGVVFFGSSSTAPGNSNNVISNCRIYNASPNGNTYCLIQSFGTTGFENTNNSILNNELFDFYSSTAQSNGIILNSGSGNWDILSGTVSFRQYQDLLFPEHSTR